MYNVLSAWELPRVNPKGSAMPRKASTKAEAVTDSQVQVIQLSGTRSQRELTPEEQLDKAEWKLEMCLDAEDCPSTSWGKAARRKLQKEFNAAAEAVGDPRRIELV